MSMHIAQVQVLKSETVISYRPAMLQQLLLSFPLFGFLRDRICQLCLPEHGTLPERNHRGTAM